ncbi:MAG: hypothetical protein V1874_00400 [Spirochaetota bacterium]
MSDEKINSIDEKAESIDEKADSKKISVIFYLFPVIINFSIMMLVTGESTWGQDYSFINGIHARLFGLTFLAFCIPLLRDIFIKMPKASGNPEKQKEVFTLFISSPFMLTWIATLVLLFVTKYNHALVLNILYFISIFACLYYQYKFVTKLKEIL